LEEVPKNLPFFWEKSFFWKVLKKQRCAKIRLELGGSPKKSWVMGPQNPGTKFETTAPNWCVWCKKCVVFSPPQPKKKGGPQKSPACCWKHPIVFALKRGRRKKCPQNPPKNWKKGPLKFGGKNWTNPKGFWKFENPPFKGNLKENSLALQPLCALLFFCPKNFCLAPTPKN